MLSLWPSYGELSAIECFISVENYFTLPLNQSVGNKEFLQQYSSRSLFYLFSSFYTYFIIYIYSLKSPQLVRSLQIDVKS